ncbi:Uncharacterised protein [Streptococcus pneumoniae]|nr:Uncharacterised protein [Streptococcus pneumoniae]
MNLLILHQDIIPNKNWLAIYMRFDPLACDILEFPMHFLMFNSLYLSLLDDGISNRMINVFLKTGTDSENIFLTIVSKR